jgi:hypothetical protein
MEEDELDDVDASVQQLRDLLANVGCSVQCSAAQHEQ